MLSVHVLYTLPETNSEFTPENGQLVQMNFLKIGLVAYFQVLLLLVLGEGIACKSNIQLKEQLQRVDPQTLHVTLLKMNECPLRKGTLLRGDFI